MCICMCICICVCMWMHVCACMYVYVCVYVCVYAYVYVCGCMYVFVCVCMCMYVNASEWICVCIYRTLFQNALSAIPENGIAMPMPSSRNVSVKSFSHMYICVYMQIFMKSSFSTHDVGFATSIFGLSLNAFWKRALHLLVACSFMSCQHLWS